MAEWVRALAWTGDRTVPARLPAGFESHFGKLFAFLVSIYSKQPIFGLTQPEWFRELSFSRLECGVHDRLHIYPLCGIFYFPWHRHQIEGTNGF